MTREEWIRLNKELKKEENVLSNELRTVHKNIERLGKNPEMNKEELLKIKSEKAQIETKLEAVKKEMKQNDQAYNAKQEKQVQISDKKAREVVAALLKGTAAIQGYEVPQPPLIPHEQVIETPKQQSPMEWAIEQAKQRLEKNEKAGDIEEEMNNNKEDKLEQLKQEEKAFEKENETQDLSKERNIDPEVQKKQDQEQEKLERMEQRRREYLENKQMTHKHQI